MVMYYWSSPQKDETDIKSIWAYRIAGGSFTGECLLTWVNTGAMRARFCAVPLAFCVFVVLAAVFY